jgi:hypothetical protein
MRQTNTQEAEVTITKKRLQFDFTEDAVQELDQLEELTRLPTRVETIRYALRFLRWAVDETNNGGTLCVERSGKIREIIPFWQPMNSRQLKESRSLDEK